MENKGTKRDIAVNIILTILTCGIYGVYWYIVLTDDVGRISNDKRLSGGICFLLTLVTCGLYGFYWAYLMGQALFKIKNEKQVQSTDNSVIYIILQLFGLQIVTLALVQNDINVLIEG